MSLTYYKRNLPHYYYSEGIYFITFCLANSIPQNKLTELSQSKEKDSKEKRIFLKYENILESGELTSNLLNNYYVAEIIKNSIHFYDHREYNLICYTIMPNHVHLVFELCEGNRGISKILQSIKRTSAFRSNKILKQHGKFWQDESFDRLVRDERELFMIIKYVLLNPVKCNLVTEWYEWKYSYCNEQYKILGI